MPAKKATKKAAAKLDTSNTKHAVAETRGSDADVYYFDERTQQRIESKK